jgi:phosphoribosylanthranilate isomerase
MTIVKICGIMDVPNGLAAIDAGADYLGFIFYPPSFRFLTVARAANLIEELRAQRPNGWQAVGVFVNEPLDRVFGVQHACGLDVVQLNGEEDETYIGQISGPVFKSVRFGEKPGSPTHPSPTGRGRGALATTGEGVSTTPSNTAVAGTPSPQPSPIGRGGKIRGSGPHPNPLSEGEGTGGFRILLDANVPGMYGGTGVSFEWTSVRHLVADGFLAGGLSPENILTALEQAQPWGVDVSSGVEREKQKDSELIRAFLAAVRTFDGMRSELPSPQPSPQRGEGVGPGTGARRNSTDQPDQAKPERMSVL